MELGDPPLLPHLDQPLHSRQPEAAFVPIGGGHLHLKGGEGERGSEGRGSEGREVGETPCTSRHIWPHPISIRSPFPPSSTCMWLAAC